MRELLSSLLVDAAREDDDVVVLSGDHGYALFDELRAQRPGQFLNVGVMEQSMVGIAAGLCRLGYRPIVYGLAAFVPIRVLEQIKLDVCHAGLPVTFIGDGAGVVYATLGVSHQCGEDLAALRPLPGMAIYSPCGDDELLACWRDLRRHPGPRYLRIGKSDRVPGSTVVPTTADPYFTHHEDAHRVPPTGRRACLVSHGAMVGIATAVGRRLGVPVLSVPRIKPLGAVICGMLAEFGDLIVVEEHARTGGLATALAETLCERGGAVPRIRAIALDEKFAERCGCYEYALSEHGLADAQIMARVADLVEV